MSDVLLWIGGILIGLGIGITIGYHAHPYEVCERMYETPEDISECVCQ